MFDFGLYTQVSDSGPDGPLVNLFYFSSLYPGVVLLNFLSKLLIIFTERERASPKTSRDRGGASGYAMVQGKLSYLFGQ